ncbi:Chromosome (plasmid) partitioning protein ParB [hydrothermal vent metagenome]|uniref:Chromosome (Plasmid) partitioning protein ParB n=1 Tax=hydrothermal vent metagenome TaxID=652676 RepID=A0A3B0RCJ2_9ZZZZ
MTKKVLGRGLSALMGEPALPSRGVEAEDRGTGYMLRPIGSIIPNKQQPRRTFRAEALAELTDSIREKGIIEPLVVRSVGSSFELIAGERRWRAAKNVGLSEVPVVVMDVTEAESLELAIIENIQREDLNPMEEAEAYQRLVDTGLSQELVAKKVSKERATVANYLRLLKLPPEVKVELVTGKISMGHARAILSLEGPSAQRELCKKVIAKGLSVREAERLARTKKKPPVEKTMVSGSSTQLGAIEDELRRRFGTKVRVKDKGGKGSIELEFYSSEERERLLDLLRGTAYG